MNSDGDHTLKQEGIFNHGRGHYDCPMLRLVFVILLVSCVLGVAACSSSGHPSASLVIRDKPISLVPDIEAGEVGWCVVTRNSVGCLDGPPREPIVSESWSRSDPPPVSEGSAITISSVRAVLIDGRRVPTRREGALPDGLRTVTVELQGPLSTTFRKQVGNARFAPLNVRGGRITERRISRELFKLPTESVPDPAHPAAGSCRIQVSGRLTEFVAESARVVTQLTPYKSVIRGTFSSCAKTTYRVRGQQIVAAVLLDAAHPGSTPAALPAMQSLQGHHEIFRAPGEFEGDMIARRIHGAWLVVSGPSGVQQRLALLEDLRATIHL